jgi:antitoxin CcdA
MNVQPKKGPKESVNLTIDAELLDEARSNALDLSHLLEEKLREERVRRWREENAEAFGDYNRDIEKSGVWSDGRRNW